MNVAQKFAAEAIPSANTASIAQRLKALGLRPHAVSVRELIDRYMAQYAGADTTRVQRLAAWQSMIGDFTLEQVDSDLIYVARNELAQQPALVFLGLDHQGRRIFKPKAGRRRRHPRH
jgi:hypothetical protein